MNAFRNKQIMVTSGVFSALKAYADSTGADCADAVADAWLRERIESTPELIWREREFVKAMRDLDERARASFPKTHSPVKEDI